MSEQVSSNELSLPAKIAQMRKAAGLTQEAFARWVNMPQSAISRLENPTYEGHTVKTLRKIADAMGMKLEIRFCRYD